MEFIQEIQVWHWLILGLVLLGAEALGAGGFFIGAAVAALVQASMVALFPEMSWQIQITTFAIMAVGFTVLYWKFFKSYNEKTDNEQINDRAIQMIGRRVTLIEDVSTGQGKVQFGDTLWKIKSQGPLVSGDIIEVYDNEGMELMVKKVD